MSRNTILLADDDANQRRLQTRILNKDFPELKVEEFKDGTSLVSRLKGDVSPVVLVITDDDMPGFSGGRIIYEYSKRPGLEKIPFILYYGGGKEIGENAVINGAFGYLTKPVNLSKYIDLVGRAISFSRS